MLFLRSFQQKRKYGPVAQLNRAFDYGSKGYRFESYRGHKQLTLPFTGQGFTFFIMQAFLYILFSESLNKFYVGSTSLTPQLRLLRHLSDHKGFTGKAKDWIIVYAEKFDSYPLARKREMSIKKWKSSLRIKELISNNSSTQ